MYGYKCTFVWTLIELEIACLEVFINRNITQSSNYFGVNLYILNFSIDLLGIKAFYIFILSCSVSCEVLIKENLYSESYFLLNWLL